MASLGRLVTLLSVIVVSGIGLAAALSLMQAERVYRAAVSDTYRRLATELQFTIETSLGLGLTLPEISSLQASLDRAQAQSHDVSTISVYDAANTILFSTNSGSIGSPVPPSWPRAGQLTRAEGMVMADGGDRIVAVPLRGAFAELAGAVAVQIPAEAHRDGETLLRFGMIRALVVLVVIAGGLIQAWLASESWIMAMRVGRMERRLAALAMTASDAAADGIDGDSTDMAARVAATLNRAGAVMDAIETRLVGTSERRDPAGNPPPDRVSDLSSDRISDVSSDRVSDVSSDRVSDVSSHRVSDAAGDPRA